MKKLSILLFLLVTFAYASAQGNIFSVFSKQLNEAQEKITKVINGGIQIIQKEIDNNVEKTLQTLNEMKQEGEDFIEDIRQRVDVAVADMEKKINEITNGVDNNIIDECKLAYKGVKEVKNLAFSIISNSSFCVTDKIDQASGYIENMNDASQEAINSLIKINNEATECTKNINNVESTVKGLACLGSASVRATWTVTKEIPEVVVTISKISFLVSTLAPSLGLCSSITTFSLLIDEANNFVSSINDCIQNKPK